MHGVITTLFNCMYLPVKKLADAKSRWRPNTHKFNIAKKKKNFLEEENKISVERRLEIRNVSASLSHGKVGFPDEKLIFGEIEVNVISLIVHPAWQASTGREKKPTLSSPLGSFRGEVKSGSGPTECIYLPHNKEGIMKQSPGLKIAKIKPNH